MLAKKLLVSNTDCWGGVWGGSFLLDHECWAPLRHGKQCIWEARDHKC